MMEEAQFGKVPKAPRHMKKYVDAKRTSLEFYVGDQVLFKLTPQI